MRSMASALRATTSRFRELVLARDARGAAGAGVRRAGAAFGFWVRRTVPVPFTSRLAPSATPGATFTTRVGGGAATTSSAIIEPVIPCC